MSKSKETAAPKDRQAATPGLSVQDEKLGREEDPAVPEITPENTHSDEKQAVTVIIFKTGSPPENRTRTENMSLINHRIRPRTRLLL